MLQILFLHIIHIALSALGSKEVIFEYPLSLMIVQFIWQQDIVIFYNIKSSSTN